MPTLESLENAAMRAALAALSSREREVQIALKDALDRIRAYMVKIYDKYAKDGKLTKGQMTQYNRLASLEKKVLSELEPALRRTRTIMQRIPTEAYDDGFFRHAWAIDASQGIRIDWGTLNMDAVKNDLDNAYDKIAIEQYAPGARASVRKALNAGLAMGKSFDAMARDLKKALETEAYKALRIIRTEGMMAINAAQDAAYARAQEKGVEGSYIWDATLDDRTRPDHGAKDGETRAEDGTFKPLDGVRPRYPADENLSARQRINCRCRLRFEATGYAPILRRTRDQGLIPYQKYSDWIKERK